MWCVLGTQGRFCIDSSLPFPLDAESLVFFLLAREDFFSPSGRAWAAAAATPWPSVTPFEPSAGLEGFEEEYRRWWERYDKA